MQHVQEVHVNEDTNLYFETDSALRAEVLEIQGTDSG